MKSRVKNPGGEGDQSVKPAIIPLRKGKPRKHMAMNPLEIIFREGNLEDAMKIERKKSDNYLI